VVVVVPDVELLDDSSFLEQEMMVVAEKQEIRNIYKIFLFFSSIPKVKYYGLVLGEPNIYHQSICITMCGGFYLEGV